MRFITLAFALLFAAAPARAQDAVNAAFAAALEQSPTPAALRIEQEEWRAQWTEYVDERPALEELRLDELTRVRNRDRLLRAARVSASSLGRDCIDAGLKNCGVDHSGSLSMPDGAVIHFQQQSGNTADEGFGTAMIILAGDADALRPIFWLGGATGVMPLQTHRAAEGGPMYVILPAYGQGTGSAWEGALFRWNGPDRAPTEIEARSWLASLNEALPPGLGVWKGPAFDWSTMTAESSLWQDSDANCCPTGGRVFVDLMIEDDVLTYANPSVEDAVLTVAGRVEPDVLGWVSRQQHCQHWTGEEPYDDARRAEIEAAVARLSCAALDADEAALRTVYAEDAAILALLDRARPAPSMD